MALALAAARLSDPAPNPRVGAVLVCTGGATLVGWHVQAGGPHAEIHALRAAGTRARGSSLYVTLEPCNHHGRTPPCVDAILDAGVARVVVGCIDPNPTVRGGGAERLRRRCVPVTLGVLADEARALIADWVARGEGALVAQSELDSGPVAARREGGLER